MNIKFSYCYCDAGNYKNWGEVIFTNPNSLALSDVQQILTKRFISQELFIAEQVRVPTLYFEDFSDDDHGFHLFSDIEFTPSPTNSPEGRSIDEFLESVQRASKDGWTISNLREIY